MSSSSSSSSSSSTSMNSNTNNREFSQYDPGQIKYKIASLNEMVHQFPQLADVAAGKAICAISDIKRRPRKNKDPLVQESLSLNTTSDTQHEREANKDPWKTKIFASVLSRLPKLKWVEMSRSILSNDSDKVERMLRLSQAELFLSKCNHESMLLGESGSFMVHGKFVYYPSCLNGINCKGMNKQYRYRNQQKDVIWMSYLYPNELYQLENTGIYTGVTRPCLLCLREMALNAEITHRLIDRKSSVKAKPSKERKNENEYADEEEENEVEEEDELSNYMIPTCQIYYNLVDQVHGYHREYVIISEPGRPLISPIARPNLSLLIAYTASNNRVMVNQNAIIWTSPIISSPLAGENIQGF